MFDKEMLEQLMKQGSQSQMQQFQDAMKTMQGMQNVPGMEDALKQMKEAQDMIASQIQQAMAQHGKTVVKKGNTSAPAQTELSQNAPASLDKAKIPAPSSTGALCKGVDFQFKQITSGELIKWIDDNHVEFGSYPQEADGGVKKILWRVLEKKDGQLLLLSKNILDYRNWHDPFSRRAESHPVTWKKDDILAAMIPWEICDLRKWLNGYFYENAFHAEEKKVIIERLSTGNGAYMHCDYVAKKMHKMNVNVLTTETYDQYEERVCRDTKDNVFLLNVKEAIDYFGKGYIIPGTVWSANMDRLAKPTEYMLKRGFFYYNGNEGRLYTINLRETFYMEKGKKITFPEFYGHTGYWLRNAGSNDIAMNSANCSYHCGQLSFISDIGSIIAGGWSPASMGNGIRPMILVKF
ncbi:MAG: DUF6273 domain-containing protein [Treponema sp.]|nr:DUF6273 domain-containing protein [Treponema sp.]MCL2252532.1 DUF6273 domain-containing protein [Treponema sp.]